MNVAIENRTALPTGYQLEEYQIQSILGHGGFGITYLALDTKLNHQVAIKEYFPNDLVVREESYNIQPKFKKYEENFAWGLKRFLHEGQALATFQHPSIVRVLRYFEAHNTAYIVMEYEQGQSLSSALKNGWTATEAEVINILLPLLEGLHAVHEAGFLHRDIKPDNIYLRDKDNSPVLLDFGAARYAMGSRSRSVTTLVTPGYAPFEQYQTKGRQGPWTDIYALGAVLYRAIVGKTPVEAPERINAIKLCEDTDPLPPVVQIGRKRYSRRLLKGIDWALQVAEKDRPQTVKLWAKKVLPKYKLRNLDKSSVFPEPAKRRLKWLVLSGVVIVVVAIASNVGYVFFTEKRLAQLRQQQSIKNEILHKEAAAEAVHLAELKSEKAAVQKALKQAQQLLKEVSRAKKAKEQLLTKLQQEMTTKTVHLAKLKKAIAKAETKIPGNIFRDRLQEGSLGPEMVLIPAGLFRMGNIQGGGDGDKKPAHWVSMKHFAMGRYEVTFADYDRFAIATGRKKPSDEGWGRGNRPVINVSWEDATAYAVWLSEQTGQQYSLPTEAQWEYVARAGTDTKYWWGSDIGSNKANCDSCGSQWDNKQTAPVGSFSANIFGLSDTVGNVWEWTCSEYEAKYSGKEQDCITPENSTSLRVIRGGAWSIKKENVRATFRFQNKPSYRYNSVGFRIAKIF
ncbi:MAG: hypothetical protein DRR19_06450 [Candidatus Parabeggiatoa sp. nov. 1]|nr:MAG: hypothetical protein DRR19_06450 [Gammaproteobacteria bacterium]